MKPTLATTYENTHLIKHYVNKLYRKMLSVYSLVSVFAGSLLFSLVGLWKPIFKIVDHNIEFCECKSSPGTPPEVSISQL